MTTPTINTAMIIAEIRQNPEVGPMLTATTDEELTVVIGKKRTLKTALAQVAVALTDGTLEAAADAPAEPDAKTPADGTRAAEALAARAARRVELDAKAEARVAALPDAKRELLTGHMTKIPGYQIIWPEGAWSTLRLTDPGAAGEDASKWLIMCNAHGTTKPITGSRAARDAGRKDEMPNWCPGHADAADEEADGETDTEAEAS